MSSTSRTRALASRDPEQAMLLLCARTQLDGATRATIANLAKRTLDWAVIARRAQQHGVTALVYRNIRDVCPGQPPARVLEHLAAGARTIAHRNHVITLELLRLLRLFATHHIAAAPFKGPILAATIYGDLALREFGDLDILVRRENLEAAGALLLADNYSFHAHLSADQVLYDRLFKNQWHHIFHHKVADANVELHWNVTPPYLSHAPDLQRLWRRAETKRLLGVDVLDLAPEDKLPQLCAHGAHHVWDRLTLVCDVAECLAATPAIEWPRVLAEARADRSSRVLFVGLLLAHHVLDAAVPRHVLRQAQADRTARLLAARALRRLTTNTGRSLWSPLKETMFHAHVQSHAPDTLRMYGRKQLFLTYYVLRWPLLAPKRATRLVRAWRARDRADSAGTSVAEPP